jgi:hypothetical protein
MTQAAERITETTNRNEPGPDTEENRALERFLDFNPPQYSGQEAESWIDQLENIFAALKYEDLQKMHFTSLQLLGPA